jgi:hypothetical protein
MKHLPPILDHLQQSPHMAPHLQNEEGTHTSSHCRISCYKMRSPPSRGPSFLGSSLSFAHLAATNHCLPHACSRAPPPPPPPLDLRLSFAVRVVCGFLLSRRENVVADNPGEAYSTTVDVAGENSAMWARSACVDLREIRRLPEQETAALDPAATSSPLRLPCRSPSLSPLHRSRRLRIEQGLASPHARCHRISIRPLSSLPWRRRSRVALAPPGWSRGTTQRGSRRSSM